jgi:hypothetical protein
VYNVEYVYINYRIQILPGTAIKLSIIKNLLDNGFVLTMLLQTSLGEPGLLEGFGTGKNILGTRSR